MARPVSIVTAGAPPFVAVTDGPPATPVADGKGPSITLVPSGAPPICLVSDAGAALSGFSWAPDAEYAWDFITDEARFAGNYEGALANTPNWTFTRASTAYYRNSAGVLTSFASGALRYGDRGALIEGAGTNLCLQSQTFGTTWSLTNATVSSDAAVAPDGTTTADKLVESASVGVQNRINQTITVANATAYAFSVYVKAAGRSYLHMRISTATDVGYKGFDLALGSVVSGGAGTGIITALANGWYRCTVIGTTDSTSAVCRVNILPASSSNPDTYTGDGTSGIYLWGAQLEATAYASSYVPTTTGSAIRAADSLTVTGVTGLDYPLSLYAEFERAVDTGGTEALFSVDSGAGNAESLLFVTGSDTLSTLVETGTPFSIGIAGALSVGTPYKAALRVQNASHNVARNATLGTANTTAEVPATPTRILFGQRNGGINTCYGYLRRLAIFSRALSDGELQALTAA